MRVIPDITDLVKEAAEEKVVLLEQLNRARAGVDNYTKLSQTFHQAQVRGHVMRSRAAREAVTWTT